MATPDRAVPAADFHDSENKSEGIQRKMIRFGSVLRMSVSRPRLFWLDVGCTIKTDLLKFVKNS